MALALGVAKRCFNLTKLAASRSPSKEGPPPIKRQSVRFALAEMLTLYQTAELMAFRAVGSWKSNPLEANSLNLAAKVFVTEAANQITDRAMAIGAHRPLQLESPSSHPHR